MSITVGIPAAIATKLILTGKISRKGIQVPIVKDIYDPVMEELDAYGVKFIEKEVNI
jgi:saccharopine dehydrogenase-like NADP-dependent oxidoreductase